MKGFTLIEILVSLAILLMLSAFSFWYLPKALGSEALVKDRAGVVAMLEEAKSLAISSKNASVYGVHIDTDKTVLFEGGTYDAGAANNKIFQFHSKITSSLVNLSGGGNDVVFSRLNGEAQSYGTIRLSEIDNSMSSTTITILTTGVIQ